MNYGDLQNEVAPIIRKENGSPGRRNSQINQMFSLVKWLLYPDNQWYCEPAAMLNWVAELVQAFHKYNVKHSLLTLQLPRQSGLLGKDHRTSHVTPNTSSSYYTNSGHLLVPRSAAPSVPAILVPISGVPPETFCAATKYSRRIVKAGHPPIRTP